MKIHMVSLCIPPLKLGLALHFYGTHCQRVVPRLCMPIASWGAPCASPAYLVCTYVLYTQPECTQLKDYLQFLMPALVLKIVLSFEVFLDAQIGEVISRDRDVFGAGICVERIVWVL